MDISDQIQSRLSELNASTWFNKTKSKASRTNRMNDDMFLSAATSFMNKKARELMTDGWEIEEVIETFEPEVSELDPDYADIRCRCRIGRWQQEMAKGSNDESVALFERVERATQVEEWELSVNISDPIEPEVEVNAILKVIQ